MKKKKHKSIWKRTLSFDEFVKIKETELRQYDTSVHNWERERYFEVF